MKYAQWFFIERSSRNIQMTKIFVDQQQFFTNLDIYHNVGRIFSEKWREMVNFQPLWHSTVYRTQSHTFGMFSKTQNEVTLDSEHWSDYSDMVFTWFELHRVLPLYYRVSLCRVSRILIYYVIILTNPTRIQCIKRTRVKTCWPK